MPNKKIVKKKTNIVSVDEVQGLAHVGTKEAIAKIQAFLENEKDEENLFIGELALEECENFYYAPNNEKEEQEFFLSWLIMKKENRIHEIEDEVERIKFSLEKFELELKVHKKVLAANKDKKDGWQYFCGEEMVLGEKSRLEELNDDADYLRAWVSEARKLITTKRYKDGIPTRNLGHYDYEDMDEADDYDCDCGCDCCGEPRCCDDDCCDDDCCDGEYEGEFELLEPKKE